MNIQRLSDDYLFGRVSEETKIQRTGPLPLAVVAVKEIERVKFYRVGGTRGTRIVETSYYAMADAILADKRRCIIS
jgi:hypothetical protein